MTTSRELRQIRSVLERAYPDSPTTWYERFYAQLQAFVKYIGIPALLLASVLPVYEFGSRYLDYQRKRQLRAAYVSYATDLLKAGENQRALAIITALKDVDQYDAKTQYVRARILVDTAIRQARQYQEAEDTTNLLLLLNKERSLLFEPFGTRRDVFELRLGLVDIELQRTQPKQAARLLDAIKSDQTMMALPLATAEIDLRQGRIATLLSDYSRAAAPLQRAATAFARAKRDESAAAANFALGTLFMRTSRSDEAEHYFSLADKAFSRREDKAGMIRVANNLAIVSSGRQDFARARYFYEREQKFSRDLGDDLGLARALTGLANVAREEGQYDESITLFMEAIEAFRQQGNSVGQAASYQGLANAYVRKGDYPRALYNARRALVIFEEMRDATGVARTMGVLARASVEVGNDEDAAVYTLGAIVMNRFLKYENTSYGQRDLADHLSMLRRLKVTLGDNFDFEMISAQATLRRLGERMQLGGLDTTVPPLT
jgi:tetratricopeptide (TPR) repeat protein